MNLPGDLLLARAGFPQDEYGGVKAADSFGEEKDLFDALADGYYFLSVHIYRTQNALVVLKLPALGVEELLAQVVDFRDVPGVDDNAFDIPVSVEDRHTRDDDIPAVPGDLPLGNRPALVRHHEGHGVLHPHRVDEGAHIPALQLLPGDGGHPLIGAVHKLHVALPIRD